ncbi:MAG TPA: hypothetical protein VNB29_00025 [Chthoniobacterales bacterium]|nr:hypothetical protein [Chthoniobacterales bacterium]
MGTGIAAPKPSKISDFDAKYSGVVFLSASGLGASGSASGTFKSSKTKESGTFTLTSSAVASGTPVGFSMRYQFTKRALLYTFSESLNGTVAATAVGSGSASISKKKITYSAVFTFGSNTFFVSGTMIRSKNGLTVTEVLSPVGGNPTTLAYSLKGKTKK